MNLAQKNMLPMMMTMSIEGADFMKLTAELILENTITDLFS
jgi:hypothetical protein